MSADPEQEIQPVQNKEEDDENFKVPIQKTVEELLSADKDDEALAKYKESLLGNVSACSGTLKLKLLRMEIVVYPEETVLSYPLNIEIEAGAKKKEIKVEGKQSMSEGKEFRSFLFFKVETGVVYGLSCRQEVHRSLICVDKHRAMLGAFSASTDERRAELNHDNAPSGKIAHGSYTISSWLTDDDNLFDVKIVTKLAITK